MTELNITEKTSSCGCGAAHDALPELDARQIPHAVRHAAIHGVVDALAPGAAVILVAPHDPPAAAGPDRAASRLRHHRRVRAARPTGVEVEARARLT